LDQNLIKEDDLLEKEDLLVKPKSNDDCETTSERKACKNCSCGRAEEIEKENLNVENNVEIKSEKKIFMWKLLFRRCISLYHLSSFRKTSLQTGRNGDVGS